MKSAAMFLSMLILPLLLTAQTVSKEAVVAATNMNVLYRGFTNPVEIAVPGITSDKVTATITNGTIKRAAKGWDVIPGEQSESVITVSVNNRKVSEKLFRVKTVPEPAALIAGKSKGIISRDVLLKAEEVEVVLPDFAWALKFKIESFTLTFSGDGADKEITAQGNKLTEEMKSAISELKRGQNLSFKDIKAIGPDGKPRNLAPLTFKID